MKLLQITLLTVASIVTVARANINLNAMFPVKEFLKARQRLQGIAYHTPLQYMQSISEQYDCNVYIKREDL